MTDSAHGFGDQPRTDDTDCPEWHQRQPAGGGSTPDAGVPPVPGSDAGPAAFGYQHRQQRLPLSAYPPQTAGRGVSALVVVGAVGAVVVVLVIGVVAGVILGGRNGESAPAAAPEPANYSIAAIENACDLVDPTPLTRWASTPRPGPVHEQTRASGDFGNLQCSLSCQFTYKSRSGDGVHWNQAAIDLQVEFTAPGSAPAYDQWKREDTTGPGVNSGEVTGIGSRGYWCTATAGTGHTTALDYIVGVQDDNVSLRVRIPTLSQHGEPVPNADDLGMIARNQARLALDGLQK